MIHQCLLSNDSHLTCCQVLILKFTSVSCKVFDDSRLNVLKGNRLLRILTDEFYLLNTVMMPSILLYNFLQQTKYKLQATLEAI